MGDQRGANGNEAKEPASPLANSPAEKPADMDHDRTSIRSSCRLSAFEKLADATVARNATVSNLSCTVVVLSPRSRGTRPCAKHDRVDYRRDY